MPDDELLALAEAGKLRAADTLDAQVKRMLADPRSSALADNFAGQWLELRNLDVVKPDPQKFPDWSPELRDAMKEETRLFFDSILRENRPLSEFLDARYTFLNERLAKHYGIEGVKGPEFRKVELANPQRGGILSQASVLTVSSYPTRTSVVIRGKYILNNILGSPPPPPPADVPPLDEAAVGTSASLRQQMEKHRADAMCASCHNKMDPLGFGLENYDGIGKWRTMDGKFPVDSSGVLPNGNTFSTPGEMRAVLKSQLPQFSRCIVEKMLTYSLGRGLGSLRPAHGGRDRSQTGRRRVRVPVVDLRDCAQSAVSIAKRGATAMMTRKSIPRRAFLRGMGTAVALPFLDAMVPAFAAPRAGKPPVRMAFVYVPNGIIMSNWNPDYEGKLAELPRILKPLEPFKDDVLMLGNLTHNTGRALLDGAGDHGRCCGSYLTGIQVKKSTVDIKAGVSMDQIVANQVGGADALPFARNRPGGFAPVGRLRFRLLLRVHQQPGVAQRDPAAAADSRSARALRTPVRQRRGAQSRSARARGEVPPQHSGFRHRRYEEAGVRPRSHGSPQARRVSFLHSRSGAAAREGGEGQRADRSAHGEAVRRAGRFRRAFQAHDRHDDDRVPGRPDARHDVPGHPRRHLARLPRDRHSRRPPSADAPSQSGRPDGKGGADQLLSHEAIRRLGGEAEVDQGRRRHAAG